VPKIHKRDIRHILQLWRLPIDTEEYEEDVREKSLRAVGVVILVAAIVERTKKKVFFDFCFQFGFQIFFTRLLRVVQ
jgi:hypothetical protein